MFYIMFISILHIHFEFFWFLLYPLIMIKILQHTSYSLFFLFFLLFIFLFIFFLFMMSLSIITLHSSSSCINITFLSFSPSHSQIKIYSLFVIPICFGYSFFFNIPCLRYYDLLCSFCFVL